MGVAGGISGIVALCWFVGGMDGWNVCRAYYCRARWVGVAMVVCGACCSSRARRAWPFVDAADRLSRGRFAQSLLKR